MDHLDLSIIIPIFNEEDNIILLYEKLTAVTASLNKETEIIAVNDGSNDRSQALLEELAEKDASFKVIEFRRNSGQTAAMMAGIDHSLGEVIITIDADLQNDPEDIPLLLEALDRGADVVSGWRKDRQDNAIKRNFPSRVANRLISFVSGVKLHDYGCSLKAYKREVLLGQRLYGEMHRFIPIYASWMGAKVVEVPVRHKKREFGVSNYGLERVFKVILDLIVVKFLSSYFARPIYFFGGFGLAAFAISISALLYMLYLKLFMSVSFILTPLPVLSAMFMLIGVMCVFIGILAELVIRTYFESQGGRTYILKATHNITAKT